MERVTIFGLGAMGEGIASNLLRAGHLVNVTRHRNPAPVDRLVAAGATLYPLKSEAVQAGDVVILCLPNSDVVECTIDEIWATLTAQHLVVDTGTSSVSRTMQLSTRLASRGIEFVEAPVAGGQAQAATAELGAFVGGSAPAFLRVKPLLDHFCATVQHFGPVGSGSRAKLISNYLVLGMVRLIIETFHTADALNIDWQKFYTIIRRGSANSGALQRMIDGILHDDDYGGYVFSVDNAFKDLSYIAELSDQYNLHALDDAALKLFKEASVTGFGQLPVSALLRHDIRQRLEELNGQLSNKD